MNLNYPVIVLANRGARKFYPENTLISFKKSLEIGVDGIKTEVYKTKDNYFIVGFNDFYFTPEKFNKETLIFSDLKKVKLPLNQRILSLDELVKELPMETLLMLEVNDEECVEKLVEFLCKSKASGRTMISSSNDKIIKKIHELKKEIYTGYIINSKESIENTKNIDFISELYSVIVSAQGIKYYGVENFKYNISYYKELDLKIFMSNIEEIKLLDDIYGYYDAIITDNIAEVIHYLEEKFWGGNNVS